MLQLHYIWVQNDFIANYGASYIRDLTIWFQWREIFIKKLKIAYSSTKVLEVGGQDGGQSHARNNFRHRFVRVISYGISFGSAMIQIYFITIKQYNLIGCHSSYIIKMNNVA